MTCEDLTGTALGATLHDRTFGSEFARKKHPKVYMNQKGEMHSEYMGHQIMRYRDEDMKPVKGFWYVRLFNDGKKDFSYLAASTLSEMRRTIRAYEELGRP